MQSQKYLIKHIQNAEKEDISLLINNKIKSLEHKLQILEEEQALLQQELENAHKELQQSSNNQPLIKSEQTFSAEEKIQIFMNLFKGREDVFPKRWDNTKTGKSGYSPACYNEWVSGKCNKPKIKCSECHNQAFIPLTKDIVRKHLAGENSRSAKRDYTIGIYPMLR